MSNREALAEAEVAKTKKTPKSKILDLVFIAMFTAVIAVCAQITLPIGAVPFTLQTLGVYTAAAMLGWKRGTVCVLVYILLGLIGVPVFAGFSGGVGTLFGVTGGYIFGFIFTALAVGFMRDKLGGRLWVLLVSMVIGLLLCYAFGTAWFLAVYNMQGSETGLGAALMTCVVPFLVPDAAKITVAAVLVNRLDKIIKI